MPAWGTNPPIRSTDKSSGSNMMKKVSAIIIGTILLMTTAPAIAAETLTAPPLQTALVEQEVVSTEKAILLERIDEQHQALSKDLRRLHRELAALKAAQDKPGLTEIIGGIGWIIGLFGTAAYVSSRRK